MRPDSPEIVLAPVPWRVVPLLGIKDLRHDGRVSAALALSIVSVLAPLLLLFGLKTGVVETLREILLKDPRNLEVIIFENTRLSREWFAQLEADTRRVRFVIPRTRTLNTLVDVENQNNYLLKHVEIIPTAAGDPLLPPGLEPPRLSEVLLSHAAAVQLAVEQGDRIKVRLKRTLAGLDQRTDLELTVAGIVPEASFARPGLFATLEFLEALEDYKDGYAVPALDFEHGAELPGPLPGDAGEPADACGPEEEWFAGAGMDWPDLLESAAMGRAPDSFAAGTIPDSQAQDSAAPAAGVRAGARRTEPRSSYASARLYAQRPEEVGPLADRLRASGLEVRTRGEDLARLRAVDRLLGQVLALIGAIALVGGYLAFGGALWITIERKRATLALLRLIGLSGHRILAFCLYQALLLGAFAFALAYLLYLLGAAALNRYGSHMLAELLRAGDGAGQICRLPAGDALAAAAATLGFTVLASLLGALHAKSVQPAECLRET
jgi:putative ABC transport system permease protein